MGDSKELRDVYRVAEIFDSIQGEGYYMGAKATFIRLQGCPVHCSWCDSEYTWGKGGESMTLGQIVHAVGEYSKHVVITGGEPMIQNLDSLIKYYMQLRYTVQIETSGYCWYKGDQRASWVTVSPKPPLNYKVPVEYYRYAQEFKWVIDDNITWELLWGSWKLAILERPVRARVTKWPYFTLMPEGCPPRPEMVEKTLNMLRCVPLNLSEYWRYTDRIQWRIGVK